MKRAYIINGPARCGKDTLIGCIAKKRKVVNCSSIDPYRAVAKALGMGDSKTEKDRKFLSDLKALSIAYNDFPLHYMVEKYNDFLLSDAEIIFFHIREPEEIEKLKNAIGDVKTVLVTRSGVERIMSNPSDANVFNYRYDIYIENNGTLEELAQKAEKLLKKQQSLTI